MSDTWLLLQSGPCDPAWNMALDEALLESAPRVGRPVLRYYSWTAAAASFGYFQRYTDVERMTALRPLVRRPTGGGLVPHDADWTYSLVIPPGHEWYGLRAPESYHRLHHWLAEAFAQLKVATQLAPCDAKELPGRCFAGPERADIVWQGRKIAGAAQRRTKTGLLVQGSVQPQPEGIAKIDWQQAVCNTATRLFSAAWQPMEHDTELNDHAGALARQKYATAEFNQRR